MKAGDSFSCHLYMINFLFLLQPPLSQGYLRSIFFPSLIYTSLHSPFCVSKCNASVYDVQIADAEENLCESEIREAHLAKSLFFIRIGDKERKNRLKVYEGLYYMSTRNFKKATSLFLDSISTFTTYELFPYDNFIFYTVLTSIISLDRVSLKLKVHLLGFLNSLYDCQYKEVRTVVYSQFLESYESVIIEAMAKAFGVTVEFIDLLLLIFIVNHWCLIEFLVCTRELSHFIAAGKLHCKIDKVAGVLETNRPDAKNALYQATIKQGDFLLNRIQKLSRDKEDGSLDKEAQVETVLLFATALHCRKR
ncbi:hypothetical protein CsSME_00038714 [Camellia sinensis var. sinensis]